MATEDDFLSDYLRTYDTKKDINDTTLNLLLKYIITTDKSMSKDIRSAYKTLQMIISGTANEKDMDPAALSLIRESYQELMEEMSKAEIDTAAIKSWIKDAFEETNNVD